MRHLVTHLYDEIIRRFPEVRPLIWEGEEDLPYLVVNYVADWLHTVAKPSLDSEILQRVVDFDRWVMDQPRGDDASDDIFTIYTVSFIEELFKYDELLPLVCKLLRRENLIENRDYFTAWVGKDRYEAAIRSCGSVA